MLQQINPKRKAYKRLDMKDDRIEYKEYITVIYLQATLLSVMYANLNSLNRKRHREAAKTLITSLLTVDSIAWRQCAEIVTILFGVSCMVIFFLFLPEFEQ